MTETYPNATDPFARFYHWSVSEGPHIQEMYAAIGRIVVAWGAAETVLAKMWWHKAFEAGTELDPGKLYNARTTDKFKALRKLIPSDGARPDIQLQRIERPMLDLEPDRHALVHGYLSMTAKGPAVLNLRNDRLAFAIDLPGLLVWAIFFADVAHQLYEEATVRLYRGEDRIYLPDPIKPPVYARTMVSGWPPQGHP